MCPFFFSFLLQVVLIYLSLYTHPCVLTVTHLIPKCLSLRPLPVMEGLLRAFSIREVKHAFAIHSKLEWKER